MTRGGNGDKVARAKLDNVALLEMHIGTGCGHFCNHRLAPRQQLLQLGCACDANQEKMSVDDKHGYVSRCTCDVVGVHMCVQRKLERQTKRCDELGIAANESGC